MVMRKPGYAPMLLLTVLLTATALTIAVLATKGLPAGLSNGARMAAVLAPLALAGVVCALRKRFFTTQS